jgi:hypothetical protein
MRRIHKHRARCHLVNGFENLPDGPAILDEWEDLILVQTPSGDRAAIVLIDHTISLDDILTTFADNQRQNIHTLYILAAVMFLPDHGDQHILEDWMAWLVTAYDGKIYGYMVKDQLVDICPIYFHPENPSPTGQFFAGQTVSVRYGPLIDARRFRNWQNGTWMIADYAAPLSPHIETPHTTPTSDTRLSPDIFATDPYLVLGISHAADQKTIRAAYLDLARHYHPDTNPHPDATRAMQAINAAYDTLLQSTHLDTN